MKTLSDLLLAIHHHHRFNELLQALAAAYPVVPGYDYKSNNVEEWKANSLRKEGFDLCLAVLEIKTEQLK